MLKPSNAARSCIVGFIGPLGVIALAASPVLGQASPVAQARTATISAEAGYAGCGSNGNSDSAAEADFRPWDVTIDASASACDYCGIVGSAAQRSSMTRDDIRAVGSVTYWFDGGCPTSLGSAGTRGSTAFSYTFRLRVPTPYSLSGITRDTTVQIGSSVSVNLWGPGGFIFGHNSVESPVEFSVTGELAPGDYRIDASSFQQFSSVEFPWNEPSSGETTFDFVLALTPPACPCDWNLDGVASTPDFFAFLDSFLAGDADFNFDGATNSQDFFDFLGCFFMPPGGCV